MEGLGRERLGLPGSCVLAVLRLAALFSKGL